MIESTLPQLRDGFSNISIPACLIQYHYNLLLIRNLLSDSIIHHHTIITIVVDVYHHNKICSGGI